MKFNDLIPFTKEEIREVDSLLSNDMPVKVIRGSDHHCYHLGFYILEELVIGHRYPHVTFKLSKHSDGYYLTDNGDAWRSFHQLIRTPLIKKYQQRLGITYDQSTKSFLIRMPLLNSVEAYTHRLLELLTQIKTVANLRSRHLLKK